MSYVPLNGAGTGYLWSNTTATTATITAPVTLSKEGRLVVTDDVGETTDVGKAAKMFMWWMQTYHPELEEQFNAVEDTKR